VFPQFLFMNSEYPRYIDNIIIVQVAKLYNMLNCIGEFKIGIKNQKLLAPHRIENGSRPKRGIEVLDLFSVKELVPQKDGVLYTEYIRRRL